MTNILVLGGYGMMGRYISKLLLEHTNVNITLAGRNNDKLNQYASSLNSSRVKTAYVDINECSKYTNVFNDHDIIVNTTCTLEHQEKIRDVILETNKDFFDVHSPSKRNYQIFNDIKNKLSQQTVVLDCGATAFLPFLELTSEPFDSVDFISYYKIYWQKHEFTKGTELEHEKMLEENLSEECLYKDGNWFIEKENISKDFEYGTGIAMLNGDVRLAKSKYSNINEIGYYVIMDSQETDTTEHTCLCINTNNETIKVFKDDGWHLAAIMAVSGIVQHLENKKYGLHLLGEYVDCNKHCSILENLGLTITKNKRSI